MASKLLRRKRSFSQRSLRPSLYSRRREREEPFHILFLKVGSTILALSTLFYIVVIRSFSRPSNDGIPYREHLLVKHNELDFKQEDNKVMILPTFTLSAKSEHDAFGIADKYLSNVNDDAPKEILQFLNAADQLRQEFSNRYGGELSARALLERSLVVLNNSNADGSNALAFRIQQARQEDGVLNMAFGGGSAVAGNGNFFHQSFPFVMESILKDPLELLGLLFRVTNGAVEHASSFPYTWCKRNFLGDHVDVASLDFGSMSIQQLETVIRNMVGTEQNPTPILVFRDSAQSNELILLLQSFVDAGVLQDPITIDLQAAFAPYKNVKEEILPPGFQQWKEFGAPPGAPGKVRQNLTLKQHELYGWLLSMHVLSAVELVVKSMLEGSTLQAPQTVLPLLPRPQSSKILKTSKWTPLLYGTPTDESYKEWKMPSLDCRTAFDPVVSGSFEDAILGGTAGDDEDLLHPKGAMHFIQGWVLALDPAERREKQLMKQWDNLGFQDYTKAYYGVPASGRLSLFLPARNYTKEQEAHEIFKYLVVCEANQKGNGCNLERDVTFTVGGIEASSVQWIVNEGAAYYGKRLCVLVDIPKDAKLVSEQEAKRAVEEGMLVNKQREEDQRRSLETTTTILVGLALEIAVTNSAVTWHKGACSVAHAIWGTR